MKTASVKILNVVVPDDDDDLLSHRESEDEVVLPPESIKVHVDHSKDELVANCHINFERILTETIKITVHEN